MARARENKAHELKQKLLTWRGASATGGAGDRWTVLQAALAAENYFANLFMLMVHYSNESVLPASQLDVIVDPASTSCLKSNGVGAQNASQAIYKYLLQSLPTTRLNFSHTVQTLTEGQSALANYNGIEVVHTVGYHLNKDCAVQQLTETYVGVFRAFLNSKRPTLRLLPVSTNKFAKDFAHDHDNKKLAAMTLRALKAAFLQLMPHVQRELLSRSVKMCLLSRQEYTSFTTIVANNPSLHQVRATDDQIVALLNYVLDATETNNKLRNKDNETNKTIDNLKNLIANQVPCPREITVYRNIGGYSEGTEVSIDVAKFSQYFLTKGFIEKAFLSTTLHEQMQNGAQIHIQITVPRGTRFVIPKMYLQAPPRVNLEAELIFAPGKRLVDFQKLSNNSWRAKMA